MLETPTPGDSGALSKRYVPPNQRNRRKSGDHRSESTPISSAQSISRSVSDAETSRSSLCIPVNGCSTSQAFRLLRQRWEAAINGCHDPSVAPSERPVMYCGTVELQLPHQVMSSSTPQNQMDFLAELRRAMDEKRNQERE